MWIRLGFLAHCCFATQTLWKRIVQSQQLFLSKHKVQQLAHHHHHHQHEWEEDGSGLDGFDDPEDDEAEDLNEGVQVDTSHGHFPQVFVLWLVLDGHEEEEDSAKEFHSHEGGKAHVEKDSVGLAWARGPTSESSTQTNPQLRKSTDWTPSAPSHPKTEASLQALQIQIPSSNNPHSSDSPP